MADDEPVSPPEILEAKKATPIQIFVRAALTLLLMYLIFGVLIPSFAGYSEIWASMKQLNVSQFLLLLGLTVLVEAMKSMAPVVLINRLRLGRSFLAQETSAMISNTVPGPSGTAMRYVTYRRYGLSIEDFGRSTIVNSLWNNAIILLMPSLAIALLATQDKVPSGVLWLTVIGLGITVVGIALVALILHSENFARRFGEWIGRVVNWARGIVNRPKPHDYAEVVVKFRFDMRDSVRRHWLGLTGVILAKEFTTFLILLVSLRSVGAGRVTLTAVEIFAVYAVVKVATMIEVTPGGVGVTETLYISALLWASGGAAEDAIVGGVFVFRMFTYLGPVLLGLVLWPVLNRVLRRSGRAADAVPADSPSEGEAGPSQGGVELPDLRSGAHPGPTHSRGLPGPQPSAARRRRQEAIMGCLFAMFAGLFPRLGLFIVWIARPTLVNAAFDTWIWPLLGIIFFPFATLMYVILYTPGFGLTGWEWFWVVTAGLFDVAHWAASATRRRELTGYRGA